MTGTMHKASAPRRVLVVGLGNPDRGDDGVGAVVAHSLVGRLPPDVAVVVRSGDIMSLIEDWAGFDVLVCVDAAAPIGSPGRIYRIDLATSELPRELSTKSSHGLGIDDAIGLARTLDLAPRDIIVYAVEGCCFDCGAPMTPQVMAATGETANCIVAEVSRLRKRFAEAAPHA